MQVYKSLPSIASNLFSCLILASGVCCVLSASTTLALQPPQDQETELLTDDPENQEDPQDDWILNKPEGALAQIKMPMEPVLKQRMITPVENQPPIKIHNYIGTSEKDERVFLLNYHDFHQAPVEAAIESTMKESMLQALSSVGARLIAEQPIRYKDKPGKAYEFRFAKNEKLYKGLARIFLVGNRQYQIAVMMKEDGFDQAVADKFLNSFRLIEPKTEPETGPETKPKAETDKPKAETDKPTEDGSPAKSAEDGS